MHGPGYRTVLDLVYYTTLLFILFYTSTHCRLKAYCATWVRLSNFRHQASSRVSPSESTQRRKVELWARNVREFLPKCRITRYI